MTNPADYTKTTDMNTKKYLTNTPYTQSFSSSAVSVGVSSYVTRNYTIPLSTATRFFSLLINVSLDGDLYIKAPNMDRRYASGQQLIATTISISEGNIFLTLYLVNQSGSTQNFPSFTLNIVRRDYTDEY